MPPPASLPSASDVAARALYLYVDHGASIRGGTPPDQQDVAARTLYLYVNPGTWGHPSGGEPLSQDDVLARILYLYVNYTHDQDPTDVAARALYLYAEYGDGEIFPWLMVLEPPEVQPGQQVKIIGDGFGDDPADEGSSVVHGVYDPTVVGPGLAMGIVSWSWRSPGLWPANSGDPITYAILVVVAEEAEDGYVSVEETT